MKSFLVRTPGFLILPLLLGVFVVVGAATSYEMYAHVNTLQKTVDELELTSSESNSLVSNLPKGSIKIGQLSPELQKTLESIGTLPSSALVSQSAPTTLDFLSWGDNGCTAGQVPQYDGSAWGCATIVSKAATTTNVTNVTAAAPNPLGNTISTAEIEDAAVTFAKLAANDCKNGQSPVYNGLAWDCGSYMASLNGLSAANQTLAVALGGTLGFQSSGSTHTLSIPYASPTNPGILSADDYNDIFTRAPLAFGDVSSISVGVHIAGGTGAVIGSGLHINIDTADGITPGLLSASDYNTFNGKQDPITFADGLRLDGGTLYNSLVTGTMWGGRVVGGTGAGEGLTLTSTSSDQKGLIKFGSSVYEEFSNRLGLNTQSPHGMLDIGGGNSVIVDNTNTLSTSITSIKPAWQSFISTATGYLQTISFTARNSRNDGGFDPYTMNLYEGTGTGGSLLGSYSATLTGNSYVTKTANFASQKIILRAGQTYTWALSGMSGARAWIQYSTQDRYGGGTTNLAGDEDYISQIFVNSPDIFFADLAGVGIGTEDVSAQLQLAAGGSGAGKAALKFTSGALLDNPEVGAVEWDGTHFYITQSDGTRQTMAFVSDLDGLGAAASYNFLQGVTDNEGDVTNDLITGKNDGQTIVGGRNDGETLRLTSTASSVKGKVEIGFLHYDEAINSLGLANNNPHGFLQVGGGQVNLAYVDTGGVETGEGNSEAWQSFTPVVDSYLTTLVVPTRSSRADGADETATLNFYDGEGTGGDLLTSTTATFSGDSYGSLYISTVFFAAQAGHTYTWELTDVAGERNWLQLTNDHPNNIGNSNLGEGSNYNFFALGNSSTVLYAGLTGVGIGVDEATAQLELGSGHTFAGGAALKFNPGDLLDTPEVGAVEWDGTNLYITQSDGTRKMLAYNDGSGGTYTFDQGLSLNEGMVTNDLITGKSGGQTIFGGTDDNENLWLSSTTSGAKGKIFFGNNSAFDEANGSLGIGTTSPTGLFQVQGGLSGDGSPDDATFMFQEDTSDQLDPGPTAWQSFRSEVTGNAQFMIFIAQTSRNDGEDEFLPVTLYDGAGVDGDIIGTGMAYLTGDYNIQEADFDGPIHLISGHEYTWKMADAADEREWFVGSGSDPDPHGESNLGSGVDYSYVVVGDSAGQPIFTVQNNGVGIGVENPTALLQLAAGGVDEGTAALKFTSGSVLGTPEDGAVEWDGSTLYITQDGGTRQALAFLNDIPTLDNQTLNHLTLGAGGTGAGQAALMLTTGSLLDSAESGAVEWDGTALYITQGGGTRKTLAYTSDLSGGDGDTTYSVSDGLTIDGGNNITNDLHTGIAGGQTVVGGINFQDNLTLSSTADGSKGKIIFGNSAYDEANNRLGIRNSHPSSILQVGGGGETVDAGSTGGGYQTGGVSVWQAFVAEHTGELTKVALYHISPQQSGSGNTTADLKIYQGDGTGGALISSQTVAMNNDSGSFGGWEDFVLTDVPAVHSGTMYTFELTPAVYDDVRPWIYLDVSNPYTAGDSSLGGGDDTRFQTYVSEASLFSVTGSGVAIGLSSATAGLELAAGSNIAGTAPLKFNAGDLLDTPEPGAMEWDGTRLYITQSDGSRKSIAYATGAEVTSIRQVSATAGLDGTDNIVLVDASAGDIQINLPDATTVQGVHYTIKRVDASGNVIAVATATGAQSIDSAGQTVNLDTAHGSSMEIVSDGIQWQILNMWTGLY